METKNQERQLKELQEEIKKLNKRIRYLEDAAHRYSRSPFDICYRFGRKVKHKITKTIADKKVADSDKKVAEELDKKLPTISVVIPTYKPNEYVEGCIKSVLEQDYPKNKIKIIVSVNGDNVQYFKTLQNQYRNNKQVQIVYTPVKGLSAARNYAKKYITTDFVTYLDDDDYFTKGYLKELARHITPDISVVCGRLVDLSPSGELDDDTYINKDLRRVKPGIRKNYMDIVSVFSPFWCKLYKSTLILDVLGEFDETVYHTEDVIFWVENIYKLQGKIFSCNGNGTEAYVRRVTPNSMSRPDVEKEFSFYVTDRIALIERFSKEIFNAERDIKYKQFVLVKINTATQHMLQYFSNLSEEGKEKARAEIFRCNCPFLNKAFFARKKGIAFCHNFSPYVDASAYVASKRLSQLAEHIEEPVNWTVVTANMSEQRKKDAEWERFYSKYQYSEKITTEGRTYFNEEAQHNWALLVAEQFKNQPADYIYSRSMWVGSHEAAYLYKSEHPDVKWYAEFSDPIYMGTNNEPRPAAKVYEDEKSFLNTYWQDIEIKVCEKADAVIFTNENQREYMLTRNSKINKDALLPKSLIWNHPRVPFCYTQIINSKIQLNLEKINIGYFGTFYPNRNYSAMLEFLNDERIELYIFTDKLDALSKIMEEHPNMHVLPMVTQLEFLNIAHKMDYCYLNDVDFPGDINPYLPSKLADYLSADTAVIALTYPDTVIDKIYDRRVIKVREITPEFVSTLKKDPLSDNRSYCGQIAEAENYKEEYVTKTSMSDAKLLEICALLKDGYVNLGYNSFDVPYMYRNDKSIIWNFDKQLTKNENTFYLYLFGLRHVYYLSITSQHTKDISYLKLAEKIINSFYEYYFQTQGFLHEMVLNDHAQAERIENLITFFHLAKQLHVDINEKVVVELIYDAVRMLSGNRYYQRNHNHGIIADKACLIGYYFLNGPDKDFKINYITNRLKAQVDYAFPIDGIHRENSIDYHYTVLNMLIGCLNIYQDYLNHPYEAELAQKIHQASEFLVYALKPDLSRPMFGDSKGGDESYREKL